MDAISQTILAGFLVFVAGQIFLKLVIEPVQQFKKTLASISHFFIRYAHRTHNPDVSPPDELKEVFDKLRELSARLYEDMELIPLYFLTSRIFFLPNKKSIYSSAEKLIGLANWLHSNADNKFDHIIYNTQKICDLLGLYTEPKNRVDRNNLNLP